MRGRAQAGSAPTAIGVTDWTTLPLASYWILMYSGMEPKEEEAAAGSNVTLAAQMCCALSTRVRLAPMLNRMFLYCSCAALCWRVLQEGMVAEASCMT